MNKNGDYEYVLRICDPTYLDISGEYTTDDIYEATVDTITGETMEEILMRLIHGLNIESVSDQMWFFLYNDDGEHLTMISPTP